MDDTLLVKAGEQLFWNVGNVAGDLFWTELRLARLGLMLLNVNGGEDILANESLTDDDGVFVVVALP